MLMERAQRLLAILTALQGQEQITTAELAEQFGVSKRTILRDIESLAAADVPVIAERGRYGGISLYRPAQVDVTRLSGSEAEILELIGVDLNRAQSLGAEAAARSAARKLATRTPHPSQRGETPDLPLGEVVAIDNSAWFEPETPADVAALIRDIRTGRRFDIDYRSSGKPAPTTMTVDPYGVYARSGRWYLIADRDGQPRMFALARLSAWRIRDETAQRRPGAKLADIARELSARLEEQRGIVITALLDADREDIARRILGSRLIDVAASTNESKVVIRVGYPELDGVRQLMQFTDHIEITDPPEARALIVRLATMIAGRHSPDIDPTVTPSGTAATPQP
ncbi:helix-turn-helix transcriptional regulator [Janibacter sp. G1551]|uniref:helix-turn-helix transcriptional regulator n=1 Tax=Janibacter sp. G1551 TaxID=3420440 RepID=UPI003CFC2282